MSFQTLPARERIQDAIVSGELDLPLLSGTVSRLLAMSPDEGQDARLVADLIRSDQGLAGRVIARVNAAVDAPVVPVASLRMAVSRLGFRRVRQFALAEACRARVFDAPGFEQRVEGLFEHAITTAAFAQEIARELREDVEEAFFAGLLHDAGEGIVLQRLSDWKLASELDDADVDALLLELHGPAGEVLARRWNLPERIRAVVRHHHDPEHAGPAERLARIVRLADDFSEDRRRGAAVVDPFGYLDHEEVTELALYEDGLTRILGRSEAVSRLVEELRR